MRNIANVVHDLRPIVNYLKEKTDALSETKDADEIIDLLEKISHDATMLEIYLDALEKEAQEHKLAKNP